MSKSQASRWNIGFLSRKPQTDSKTSSSVDHVNGIAIPSTLRVRCPSIQHQAQRSIRIDQRIRGIAASRMTKFYGMNSLFFMLSSTSPVPRLSLTLPPPSSLVRWSLFEAYAIRPLVHEECTATGQAPSRFFLWRLGRNGERAGSRPP